MNVKKIVEEHLKKIYFEEFEVYTHTLLSGGTYIGFRLLNHTKCTTYFDINVINNIFYILNIEIEKEQRGKGKGAALYELLETIAKSLGCKRVQMTPSGWIPQTGETRKSYLLRRGYKELGNEVFKEIT